MWGSCFSGVLSLQWGMGWGSFYEGWRGRGGWGWGFLSADVRAERWKRGNIWTYRAVNSTSFISIMLWSWIVRILFLRVGTKRSKSRGTWRVTRYEPFHAAPSLYIRLSVPLSVVLTSPFSTSWSSSQQLRTRSSAATISLSLAWHRAQPIPEPLRNTTRAGWPDLDSSADPKNRTLYDTLGRWTGRFEP